MTGEPPLPVEEAIPRLKEALASHPIVIFTAPPGAGKSTRVPLALRDEPWLEERRILMLEPRRIAARSVAARMAAQSGGVPGGLVGYRVRGESRVCAATRIEVVTEGILTRALLARPDLEDVGLVVFDEFHERSIHADLGLSLARRAQSLFRPDLRILLMSATLDETGLAQKLGGAPVVRSEGRSFPVEISYAREDLALDRDIVPPVTAAVRRVIASAGGDLLVFLQGVSEIRRTAASIADLQAACDVRELHGAMPLDEQQAAILPGKRRRVVLATNIAETSLTIEGIATVIDSGLARVSRFDPSLGLSRLETVRIAQDNARQRAGRAGRVGPGRTHRLWTEGTQAALAPSRPPEIVEADLLPLALDLASWGEEDAVMPWITAPAPGGLAEARRVLKALGAIDTQSGAITTHGRAIHELGVHPRIGHLLLEGRARGLGLLAADLAALLEERDFLPREAGADLTLRVDTLRGRERGRANDSSLLRLRDLARDHASRLRLDERGNRGDTSETGTLLAFAYPERIAQRRQGSTHRYRLANGRGASLDPSDPLGASEWLAVAHVDARGADGRILLAAPVDPSTLPKDTRENTRWDASRGALIAERIRVIGELVVDAKTMPLVEGEGRKALLAKVIRDEGLFTKIMSDEARTIQARVLSLRAWGRAEFPDFSDDRLTETLGAWLGEALAATRTRDEVLQIDTARALLDQLDWPMQRALDRLAPLTIEAPTGSMIRLQYAPDGASPVLAVRLQEIFGWLDTPAVDDGRRPVMLHLLSPARRPVQVTQDLKSFWRNTYPEVRKELRARYPRHSWPEEPLSATPRRGPKRRP